LVTFDDFNNEVIDIQLSEFLFHQTCFHIDLNTESNQSLHHSDVLGAGHSNDNLVVYDHEQSLLTGVGQQLVQVSDVTSQGEVAQGVVK
jgi:hypothetical protein